MEYLLTFAPSTGREPEILEADSCTEVGHHLVFQRFVPVGPWIREATVLRIERHRIVDVRCVSS